jgi:Chromo (CHRromatin Organisation MOdifier) domain
VTVVSDEVEQVPQPEGLTRLSAEEAFAKIRCYMEAFRSPTPEAELMRRSPSPSQRPTFQNSLGKYEPPYELMQDSPEPQDVSQELTPSSCLSFVDSGVAFNSPLRRSADGPRIQETTPPDSSPFIDPRVAFKDLFESSEGGSVMQDLNSSEIAADVLCPDLDGPSPIIYEVFLGSLSESFDFAENVELDHEKDDVNVARPGIPLLEKLDPSTTESECSSLDIPNLEIEEYTPKQFMAEQKTHEGLQFLVQLQDYPEEKDWTWETQPAMIESAPDLVTAWTAKTGFEVEEKSSVTVNYIVERILGRRKFKGVPHYLVKWKGYETVKDRTWEPCERLRVDVPLIVEAFEEKKRKKRYIVGNDNIVQPNYPGFILTFSTHRACYI